MKKIGIILVSIGLCASLAYRYFAHNETTNAAVSLTPTNNKTPTYESRYMLSKVYTLEGKINYQLEAHSLKHYQTINETLFEKPFLILFDDTLTPAWNLSANHAKLDGINNILYLSGQVEINNLADDIELKEVRTESIQLNLTNKDVWSDEKVTLKGISFASEGFRLEGNLAKKFAKLIDNVRTYYEIQNETKRP